MSDTQTDLSLKLSTQNRVLIEYDNCDSQDVEVPNKACCKSICCNKSDEQKEEANTWWSCFCCCCEPDAKKQKEEADKKLFLQNPNHRSAYRSKCKKLDEKINIINPTQKNIKNFHIPGDFYKSILCLIKSQHVVITPGF
eukprot:271302_1